MKHDKKIIDEIGHRSISIPYAMKQYAEHMVQQERERIINILKGNMTAKNSYNMTYTELIKAINQE